MGTAPMGFFDPLGLSAGADEKKIAWFREVEVKHGRVCMWASVGYFYGELFHPFYGGDLSGPAYQYAKYAPMNTFWVALAVAIAIPEVLFLTQKFPAQVSWAGDVVNKDDRVPGDMGFDPLGLKDSLDFVEMQNKELNNGRLAMLAWAGMVAQEMATGKTLLADVAGKRVVDSKSPACCCFETALNTCVHEPPCRFFNCLYPLIDIRGDLFNT